MRSKSLIFHLTLIAVLSCLVQDSAGKVVQQPNFKYKEAVSLTALAQPPTEPLSLWYERPASHWEEAMPVGNGRLGAMVYGGVGKEIIQLNEESIWAGPPVPEISGNASTTIDQVRTLLFEGKYAEAQKLQQSIMAPRISPRSYQTLGELRFDFGVEGEAADYRRDLNLDTAIASTQYSIRDVDYLRQVTVSPVDQVIAIRITANKPSAVSFNMSVTRKGTFAVTEEDSNTLVARGRASHGKKHQGVKFAAAYKAVAENGSVTTQGGSINVDSADAVTIYITVATDYNRDDTSNPLTKDLAQECLGTIATAVSKGFKAVKDDAIASHQKLFRRVELELGEPSNANTLKRLQGYKQKDPVSDANFEALYFQYGRYLLITSSRAGKSSRESAGHLVQRHGSALEQRLSHQHQCADELLAG